MRRMGAGWTKPPSMPSMHVMAGATVCVCVRVVGGDIGAVAPHPLPNTQREREIEIRRGEREIAARAHTHT